MPGKLSMRSKGKDKEISPNSETDCPKCKKSFNDKFADGVGKILKCKHTLCFKCCNETQKFGKIKCPTCGNPSKVPKKGIEALKTVELKKKAKQKRVKVVRCEECSFNKSKVYCVDCEMDICAICDTNIVHKALIFGHHRRVPVEEKKESIVAKKKEDVAYRIEKYEERLRLGGDEDEWYSDDEDYGEPMYCTVCNCNVTDESEHIGHNIIPLSELAAVLAEAKARQAAIAAKEEAERKAQEDRLKLVSAKNASKKEKELKRQLEEKQSRANQTELKLAKMREEAEARKAQLTAYTDKIEKERLAREKAKEDFERSLREQASSEEARLKTLAEYEAKQAAAEQAMAKRVQAHEHNLRRANQEAERKAAALAEAQTKLKEEAEAKTRKFQEYQDKLAKENEARSRKLFEYEEKLKSANIGARERKKKLEGFSGRSSIYTYIYMYRHEYILY